MSNPKPIVVYLHRYPPEVEAFQWPALRELAAALQPDYDLHYFCMGPASGRRDETLRRMMRVVELPFTVDQANGRDKWLKTFRWYLRLGGMIRKIRALSPVVVICKETLPLIPGRVVRTGLPVVIGTNDWWWSILFGQWPGGRWLTSRMEAWEVRGWNRPNARVVVCTQASAALIAARGMSPERIVVINEPRNPDVFRPLSPRPAQDELGLDGRCRHVAIFGIIRGGKGYDQLLDWWKTAAAAHSDWRLVIIGGAGGEAWCRREIAKRGLEDAVLMTGWLPTKQEVNRWLNAMDALLVHRRNSPDNLGIIPSALYNGLSTGRPVVVSGLPGMAEVVRDGVDGLLYAPDDGMSFQAALERIVGDPEAAEKLGRSGLARAEECFNTQRVVADMRQLIDRLAAG